MENEECQKEDLQQFANKREEKIASRLEDTSKDLCEE